MSKKIAKMLVPALRFPEFRNAGKWPYLNSNNIFDHISNKNHASDLPILAITQEYGAIPRELIDYNVSVTDKSVESYKVVEVGDFIISLRSFQGGIEYSNYKGICSPAYVILRRKNDDIVDCFLKFYLKTSIFIDDLNKDIEGIRDGKMVGYKQFSDILLPAPRHREQQKIADCLSSIDALIKAQSQKVDALKTHKKSLIQQLFPCEGKNTPCLRFPAFLAAGEWRHEPLKQVFSIFQGFAFSSNDSTSDGARWLKIADVRIQQMNHSTPSYLPIAHKAKYEKFLVKQGDYVIALTRPILSGQLKIAPVDIVFAGALLNQRVGKLVTDQNIEFVYYLLQMPKLINAIDRSISGSEPPNLSVQQIEDIKTCIPSEKEQQKIAACLASIDALITAQTQKLEALKTHKKGLLQALFPAPDEVEA